MASRRRSSRSPPRWGIPSPNKQHPEIKTISGCLCVWARPQPSWRLRPAAAWKIQYLAEDGSWKDVEPTEDYTIVRNLPASRADTDAKGWSTVTFKPVTTKSLRLVLTPHTGSSTFGAAVAEWACMVLTAPSLNLPRSTRPCSSRLLIQPTASMQAVTPPLHGLSSSESLTLPRLCTTMPTPPKNRSPSR